MPIAATVVLVKLTRIVLGAVVSNCQVASLTGEVNAATISAVLDAAIDGRRRATVE